MKKKNLVHRAIYKFIENGGIEVVLSIICIIVILILDPKNTTEKVENFIDITLFSTVIITSIFITISNNLKNKILVRLEDSIKLSVDYEELVEKYPESQDKFVKFDNSRGVSQKKFYKKQRCKLDKSTFVFPVIKIADLSNKKIVIHHRDDKVYSLPWFSQHFYEELMKVHHGQANFNNCLFRVDKWYLKKGKFIINTSRTTFYDSLVTNRSIDLCLENGVSGREIYENRSKISDLEDSQLSNHLGFNGFVETSDGWIPIVKRSSNVSIGKSTYGNSVNASVKRKYAYKKDEGFTKNGLIDAILHTISDELKISYEWLDIHCRDNLKIIAAYRDVVEGGKPQILFYVKLNMKKQALHENFCLRITKEDWTQKMTADGKKLAWLKTESLKTACIAPDMVVCDNKVYKMVPSTSACFVMLLEYLENQ